MAKKDISKFQKALLSKTNVMKEEAKKEEPTPLEEKQDTKTTSAVHTIIEEELLEKYKALSEKHNIALDELIKFGLNFFLEFEEDLFKK